MGICLDIGSFENETVINIIRIGREGVGIEHISQWILIWYLCAPLLFIMI